VMTDHCSHPAHSNTAAPEGLPRGWALIQLAGPSPPCSSVSSYAGGGQVLGAPQGAAGGSSTPVLSRASQPRPLLVAASRWLGATGKVQSPDAARARYPVHRTGRALG
jgi:hypothetical protein